MRPDGVGYLIRLEGGSSPSAGASAPADCALEARGALEGSSLRARFGPIRTETLTYSADDAARENRSVEIAFGAGLAVVIAADTLGYCGLSTDFLGRYARVR